jgi:hypothetical protein
MFNRIRERITGVAAAIIGSVVILGCGLVFTFFLAPKQKIEAQRIDNLPLMDAAYVTKSSPGDVVLITGRLVDNPIIFQEGEFIVYTIEEWEVSVPEYDPDNPDKEPDGNWKMIKRSVPDLTINVNGILISTLSTEDVYFNGQVHVKILNSSGYDQAKYMGDWLSEGSRRVRGFINGDLVTVWGKRATSDAVIPEELYAGDRVSYVESKHAAAKGLLIAGISMMVCSPVILLGGILLSIFGRRKRL